jgi:hypothetical protein
MGLTMCQLTEPVPGMMVAFWPPNLAWAFFGAAVLVCIAQIQRLRTSQLPWVLSMKATMVWKLALASCLLIVLAATYIALVAWPTDAAQRARQAHEEAVLPPECVSATIDQARNAASAVPFVGFVLFFVAPLGISGLLYYLAGRGRGLDFKRW